MSTSTSSGASAANAAIVLDAYSSGGGSYSEIGLIAGRVFAMAGGSAGAVKNGLFVVDGNAVYIDNARIRNLTAANIDTDTILISDSLQLGPNVVITGAIAAGAITTSMSHASSSISAATSGTFTVLERTITSETGQPILLFGRANYRGVWRNLSGSNFGSAGVFLYLTIDGSGQSASIGSALTGNIAPGGTSVAAVDSGNFVFWIPPGPGTYTCRIFAVVQTSGDVAYNASPTCSSYMAAQSNRR